MKKDEKIRPLITCIVPIYNGENWIRRCLDSLVYQSLENIEIIAVNNGSTDGTYEVLEQYHQAFPNKVFIGSIEHTNGPGGGRNYGLAHARAPYIIFADADDYFDTTAFEELYNKAVEDDYDMVYCASYDVKGVHKRKTRTLKQTDKAYIQRYGSMVFWNKLIKRELFDKAGKVPEDIVFEDIAYVSTLISLAEKIAYIDKPLYYYILRDDSGVNDLSSERLLHSLRAYDIAIKNCHESVKDQLIASIAHRICFDLRNARWTFADKFIEYIKNNQQLFDTDLVREENKTYGQLREIEAIDYEPFPEIVYINGFGKRNEAFEEQIKEKAFFGETELIVLNEVNCDYSELPILQRAYEKKDFDFLAKYFAMKKIYETGGIYLDSSIEIINIFNCLRYCKAFFGYLTRDKISDSVFGGIKGNEVFKSIIDTYSYDGSYADLEFTLSERIKNVLVVKENMKLDGKTTTGERVCVLSPEVLVSDLMGTYHICRHNFAEKSNEEGYVTLSVETMRTLMNIR